ncbi:MAG: DinB family protein [Thermomicrobiales bacterium]
MMRAIPVEQGEAVPERGCVSGLGMDDWRRRGIGESLVSWFGCSGNPDGSRPANADATVPDAAEETGTTEQDWTQLPAGGESGRMVRAPEEILRTLAATPVELGRLLEEAAPDTLTQPSHDGGAAVVEIVAHLRDWDIVVDGWIEQMLAGAELPLPILEVPDDSLWTIEHDYATEDPHRAFAAFRDRRAGLLDRLGALDGAGWERRGVLDSDGERTVQETLDILCDRDTDHLQRVREALT